MSSSERNTATPFPDFMQLAIDEARQGIAAGDGGPFGSVIVKNGEIVGRGHNRVIAKNDPTCHGEMEAIRAACRNLNTYDLTGCELYTTAEPCPMCLGAILWSNISAVYYGCTRQDSAAIGFRGQARQLNNGEHQRRFKSSTVLHALSCSAIMPLKKLNATDFNAQDGISK